MNTENSQKKEFKKGTQPFEFTIFLNENIVVQRYFNVIGFNNKSINSMNFKETIDYNKYIIEKHLKDKSLDFMNDNARAFYENPNFDQNLSKDVLKIVVKHNDKVIAYRECDATIYPTKVRYSIDIREHIYEMITKIQKCLSEKTDRLETSYLTYDLAV